jgi:hypothetical protein
MTPDRSGRLAAWLLVLASPFAFAGAPRPAAAEDTPPPEPAMEGDAAPGMDEPAGAADDEESDVPESFMERVGKSIDRGVAWLKKKQGSNGSWGEIKGDRFYDPNAKGTPYVHPAGPTGLALYALLKSGVPAEDPVVKKGFAFLQKNYRQPGSSYEVSAVLLAVTATADPFKKSKASRAAGDRVKLTGEMRKWAEFLHGVLLRKHKQLGWRYNTEVPGHTFPIQPGGDQDTSSTQLATLALLAADRCGILTPSQVWADAIAWVLAQQETTGPEADRAVFPKGEEPGAKKPKAGDDRYGKPPPPGAPPKDRERGFSYIKSETLPAHEGKPTRSMTACGISTLLTARYVLTKRDDRVWKKLDAKAVQQAIYDGYAWLNGFWSSSSNSSGIGYHIYYQYCVERACDLTGNALIGTHNWYQEMGEELLGSQKDEGQWDTGSTHQPKDVLDTCFALLFLKRATRGGIPYPTVTGGSDEPPVDARGK